MSKNIKLRYNLIYFNVFEDNVKMKVGVDMKDMLYQVCCLLDRDVDLDYTKMNTEVYIDKTKELIFVNTIIKTKVQTISIQIIPDIYVRDQDNIDSNIKLNRIHQLKTELIKYGNSLLTVLKNSQYVTDIVAEIHKPNTPNYIALEHWNQIPINFK